VSNIMTSW